MPFFKEETIVTVVFAAFCYFSISEVKLIVFPIALAALMASVTFPKILNSSRIKSVAFFNY